MSSFLDDVRAQPVIARTVLDAYRGPMRGDVAAAARIVAGHPSRSLLVLGMGSSLAAGRILPTLLAPLSRIVLVEDAGEHLHYGVHTSGQVGAVVAISQSGRSYETVHAVEAIRAARSVPVVAVVNDVASPLAASADVVLPLLAGPEAAIATKTYLATMVALALLAGVACPGSIGPADLDRVVDVIDAQVEDRALGPRVAAHLRAASALIVIGRGPALSTAAYGGLTIKEAATIPIEAMSGGAFRHGPVELIESGIGLIALAPAGRTTRLILGIAQETAARGRPVWLITDSAHAAGLDGPPTLLVSPVAPDLPEALAPLALAVPVQLATEALARLAGRRAGVTSVATKVTDRE